MSDDKKRYLGDGVYIEDQGYHLVLTTENGIATTNTIFLDSQVVEALIKYVKDLKE